MATVHDYLRWRGDLSFAERSFNDVDNLILATLAYLDFSGIVPSEHEARSVSLRKACSALLNKAHGDVSPYVRSLAKVDTEFVELLCASRRFGDARLGAYADLVDDARSLQFSAIEVTMPQVGTYVSFRGTDSTLVGWRENLMLSFTVTEAQREAARYLERTLMRLGQKPGAVLVGGHSKGGNLAEYAAVACPEHLRGRIAYVYSNDGPGFAPEVVPFSTREVLGDALRHIVPSYSVVGMIFARDTDQRIIVASSAQGIEQHDPTTWQVTADGMEEVDALQPECEVINRAIATWADGLALEDRERVTNDVFDALGAGGATTFHDISASPEQLQQVLSALGACDRRTREVAMALVQCTVDSSVGAVRQAALRAVDDARRAILERGQARMGTTRGVRDHPGLRVFIDTSGR